MNVRHWLRLTYPATALLIAGCGGGGGGSAGLSAPVPVVAPTAGAPAPQGHMVIAIPNSGAASSQNKVSKGISPAASSISIAVTGIASPQVADISATSPNCTASSSGRTCTIPVQATVGNDTFTVTIFDGPNATGHQLGVGSAATNVVPGAPFQVNITLNGVIAALQFVIKDKSGSGTGTGTGSSSVGPPVGQAGSVIGTVAALDASGNYIVGPYSSTVTITSSNPSISVSPASLTGSGPVTFSYDGVATTPVTLSAATGSITATFTVTPSTNIIYYPLPSVNPFTMFAGPDGKYYINEFGPEQLLAGGQVIGTGPGKIARFDPVSKTFSGEVTVGNSPIGMAWAPDGSIFQTNSRDFPGTIGHLTGFSTYTPVQIPSAPGIARHIVLGPDGNMWFIEQRGNGPPFLHANVGKFNPATPGSITEYALPAGSRAQWMTVGPDNNFYVTDSGNGAVDQVTTSGNVTAFPIPGATPGAFNVFPRFITNGSDGNLYLTDLGSGNVAGTTLNGNVWRLTTAGAFTKINMPLPASAGPDTIVAGASGTLFFSDLQNLAVGKVTTSGTVTEWPITQACGSPAGTAPDGMLAASDGSIWYTSAVCSTPPAPPSPSLIGHLIFASGWTVFPVDTTIQLSPVGSGQQQLLGIAESGDSSPFTVVSSNPAVVSVSSAGSSGRNFVITALSNGTATVTVTDSHGTSVVKNVTVTSATGTIQSTQRRAP